MHPFSHLVQGFAISPMLQEMMVYVGQMETYGQGVEVLAKLAGVSTNQSQLYRVTDTYGGLLAAQEEEEEEPAPALTGVDEVVYAEADGSMVLTKEGWREVKLGRVFRGSDCRQGGSAKRNGSIGESKYSAFLGHFEGFTRRFSPDLVPYAHLEERLVFLTDGATWIRNWISEAYPDALQILDFFHVKEHLAHFAQCAQPEVAKRKAWLDEQAERLKQGRLDEVMAEVRSFTLPLPAAREEQSNLINYLWGNQERMQYDLYLEAGLFIGSGAIEAAHRTVIQSRMKKSGQRWSLQGAQNMLNLRTVFMSNQWEKIENLISLTTAKAA